MNSKERIKANRLNALKSCGPRTAEGKMIAAQNARKHGFYSTAILLHDEDRNQYVRLARGVVKHHSPVGELEFELVITMIQTLWQLRRANIVDTELFQMYRFYENEERERRKHKERNENDARKVHADAAPRHYGWR